MCITILSMNTQHAHIIKALGGATKIARWLGLTPQAVNQWKTAGIPKPWLKVIQLNRPDLFNDQDISYSIKNGYADVKITYKGEEIK